MIKATGDIIIVELQYRAKTSGGLFIPTATKSEPQSFGKVISKGPDVKDEGVKDGVMLVFHPRAGQDMLLNDIIYKVIKYAEIYGIIDDKQVTDGLAPMTISGNSDGDSSLMVAANKIR